MLVTLGEPETTVYDVVRVGVMPTAAVVVENHPAAQKKLRRPTGLRAVPRNFCE